MGLIDNIKNAARGNNTIIQSSEEQKITNLFNKMFYLEKDIDEETKFIKQIMTRGLESQERVGLHASSILANEKDYCIRAQVLSLIYKQSQGEEISPSLKRIFEEGNAIHEKWQRLFIRAGYAKAINLDYTQFDKEYMLSFTPDAIISIPDVFNKEDIVVEIKSVNTFQFKKMVEHNGKHPSAWKQVQFYMYKTNIKHGIVLCEDKNTQEFRIEYHPFDITKITEYLDRLEQIKYSYDKVYNEGKMIKRPESSNNNPNSKKCINCHMKDSCYNIGMGRIKLNNSD